MNEMIKKIVGKRIHGVVVKEGHGPASQVFLVFDDDTHYELYAETEIHGIKGIDTGGMDTVRAYMAPRNTIILEHAAE